MRVTGRLLNDPSLLAIHCVTEVRFTYWPIGQHFRISIGRRQKRTPLNPNRVEGWTQKFSSRIVWLDSGSITDPFIAWGIVKNVLFEPLGHLNNGFFKTSLYDSNESAPAPNVSSTHFWSSVKSCSGLQQSWWLIDKRPLVWSVKFECINNKNNITNPQLVFIFWQIENFDEGSSEPGSVLLPNKLSMTILTTVYILS